MKLKARISLLVTAVAAVLLLSGNVMAASHGGHASDWKVGVGYQGMWAGEFLNGVSARAWYQDRFGMEGNFFYGGVDARVGGNKIADADLYVGEIKLMYAPVVREYSKFYAGIQGSVGSFEIKSDIFERGGKYSDEIWGVGVFIGSEFHFQEFPELGFNFDVGYRHYMYDDRIYGERLKVDLKGIGATFGIHYYF